MNDKTTLLEWATRIVHRVDPKPYQLLEIKETANLDDAQQAFHKVARMAHPDLHRNSLSAEEIELVTSAYAKVAGAYQDYRQLVVTARQAQLEKEKDTKPATAGSGGPAGRYVGVGPGKPQTPPEPEPEAAAAGGPQGQMNSKAMLHYRKAEMSLRRGELKTAVLQLKMAAAADPQSKFVRLALAEVMAEMAKSGA